MNRILNKIVVALLVAGSAVMGSCTTEDLNPSLEQNKEGDEAIRTSADIEGILRGTYNRMTSFEYYGRDYIVTNEVRTPNIWANGNSGRFTTEASFLYNANGQYIWDNAYAVIASANIIINADVSALTDVADNEEYARHLQGQAYVIRALAHFDLVKSYGQEHVDGNLGVPYVTEFKGDNEIPGRNTLEENEQMIFSDLQTGFDMMSDDFYDSSKTFISKYTAKALESRVAVWYERWEDARDAAEAVIESGLYSIVPADQFVASFASGGQSNSIFELEYNATDNQGINGLEYIYRGSSYGDISVTPTTFNELYEENDVREDILGTEEVGDNTRLRNMGKYPDRTSNVVIIRYEEVILNYAEALYELGETEDALDWLNEIPEHRNAAPYTEINQDNILEERRKEFLFEGLYYWDLQRMERDIEVVDDEQLISEPVLYGDFRRVHPIPNAELDANSNIEQNPGY